MGLKNSSKTCDKKICHDLQQNMIFIQRNIAKAWDQKTHNLLGKNKNIMRHPINNIQFINLMYIEFDRFTLYICSL